MGLIVIKSLFNAKIKYNLYSPTVSPPRTTAPRLEAMRAVRGCICRRPLTHAGQWAGIPMLKSSSFWEAI